MDSGQQILALLQELRREVNEKFDKLPDTYTTQREHQALVDRVGGVEARQERFDEWRASMIERQYQTLLNLSQRTDDQTVTDLRGDLTRQTTSASAQHSATTSASSAARNVQARWLTTVAGWGVSLLIVIITILSQHATWH